MALDNICTTQYPTSLYQTPTPSPPESQSCGVVASAGTLRKLGKQKKSENPGQVALAPLVVLSTLQILLLWE